jgi:hypothetical protein
MISPGKPFKQLDPGGQYSGGGHVNQPQTQAARFLN